MCIGSNNGLLVPSQERSANRETDNKCAGRYHTRRNKVKEHQNSYCTMYVIPKSTERRKLKSTDPIIKPKGAYQDTGGIRAGTWPGNLLSV